MLQHAGALAGALLVVQDGGLELQITHRLDGQGLVRSSLVATAMRSADIQVTEIAPDLIVDAAAVSFRPAAVALVPIRFKEVPVAIFVLAYATVPTPERLRLLASLRDPTSVALNNALTHDRFQRLAAVDPLTGAYNRRFGYGRLQEEFARSVRAGTPLGLLAFDLDHFKAVNDTFGHLVGDEVLRAVTEACRLALREGDVLVRTGGEEFLVVMPGAATHDVEVIGQRLRRSVSAASVPTAEEAITVTVSVGGVSFPQTEADQVTDLLGHVDQAVYASKSRGRDCLTLHAEALSRAGDLTRL
jgi:two-component system, cell cycle response regulator